MNLLDTPVAHPGGLTIARWGGWLVQVVPMLFNDRLVLTPEAFPHVYDYGWCFPKGHAAVLAAKAWNPETEAEPPGFIKSVVPGRKAGQKAEDGSPGREYLSELEAAFGIRLVGDGTD